MQDKDWKTNKHMGCANTNVLPMANFGRMEGNRDVDRRLAGTYELPSSIFDATEQNHKSFGTIFQQFNIVLWLVIIGQTW